MTDRRRQTGPLIFTLIFIAEADGGVHRHALALTPNEIKSSSNSSRRFHSPVHDMSLRHHKKTRDRENISERNLVDVARSTSLGSTSTADPDDCSQSNFPVKSTRKIGDMQDIRGTPTVSADSHNRRRKASSSTRNPFPYPQCSSFRLRPSSSDSTNILSTQMTTFTTAHADSTLYTTFQTAMIEKLAHPDTKRPSYESQRWDQGQVTSTIPRGGSPVVAQANMTPMALPLDMGERSFTTSRELCTAIPSDSNNPLSEEISPASDTWRVHHSSLTNPHPPLPSHLVSSIIKVPSHSPSEHDHTKDICWRGIIQTLDDVDPSFAVTRFGMRLKYQEEYN